MAFFGLIGNDRAMAAQYAAKGRESATTTARRRQSTRGTLGRPHRTPADADRAGWKWWDKTR